MSELITSEQIRHIALLSRLECDEEEIARYAGELNRVLEYVEQLRELDTDDVEPTAHPMRLTNVLREDEPHPSLSNDAALANAAETENGHFKVPQIIQES